MNQDRWLHVVVAGVLLLVGLPAPGRCDSADQLKVWLSQAYTFTDHARVGHSLGDLVSAWPALCAADTAALDGMGPQVWQGQLQVMAFGLFLEPTIVREGFASAGGEGRDLTVDQLMSIGFAEATTSGGTQYFFMANTGVVVPSPPTDIAEYKDEYCDQVVAAATSWSGSFRASNGTPSQEWSREMLPIALSVRRKMLSEFAGRLEREEMKKCWGPYEASCKVIAAILFRWAYPRAMGGEFDCYVPEKNW